MSESIVYVGAKNLLAQGLFPPAVTQKVGWDVPRKLREAVLELNGYHRIVCVASGLDNSFVEVHSMRAGQMPAATLGFAAPGRHARLQRTKEVLCDMPPLLRAFRGSSSRASSA